MTLKEKKCCDRCLNESWDSKTDFGEVTMMCVHSECICHKPSTSHEKFVQENIMDVSKTPTND